jgi:gliding motility-associated-like protein
MNTVKDLLENHSARPSEDVWQKLNARLDTEMPVGKTSFWSGLSKAKKAVAAAVAGFVLAGGVTLGWMLYHSDESSQSEKIAATKPLEKIETVNESEVVDDEVVVEEQSAEVLPTEPKAEIVVEKQASANVPILAASEKVEKTPVKSNVKQEVLPSNSTLAKQLAADPVLKNLSNESVDWSMPAKLSIPNLFTPNGDGVNDLFVIEGLEQYSSPKLVVRDKNGRVVYQNSGYKNTWGGENCPDGVYNYEFTFVYNGIENQATGKVRIIRA